MTSVSTHRSFSKEEFADHLKNTMESEKSVYDRIAYDSAGVEKGFAQGPEKSRLGKRSCVFGLV